LGKRIEKKIGGGEMEPTVKKKKRGEANIRREWGITYWGSLDQKGRGGKRSLGGNLVIRVKLWLKVSGENTFKWGFGWQNWVRESFSSRRGNWEKNL